MKGRLRILWSVLLCLSTSFAFAAKRSGAVDLELTSRKSELEVLPNQVIYYPVDVTNHGEDIPQLAVEGYWSNDGKWDKGDQLISTEILENLTSGATGSASLKLNVNVGSGQWNLIIKVFPNDDVSEEESPRYLIIPTEVKQKDVDFVPLVVTPLTVVNSAGKTSKFLLTVQNEGNTQVLAGESLEYEVYFSDDDQIDESDELLSSVTKRLSSGQPFDPFEEELTVTFPQDVTLSNAYLLFKCTYVPTDDVGETDESNNAKPYEVRLGASRPNLALHFVLNNEYLGCNFLVDLIGVEKNQHLQIHLANNGNESIVASKLTFYQSEDRFFDASDLFIDSAIVDLPANTSKMLYPYLEPDIAKIQEGYRYVLAVADPMQEIEEASESDNVKAIEFIQAEPGVELWFKAINTEGIFIYSGSNTMPEGWAEGIKKTDHDTVRLAGTIKSYMDIEKEGIEDTLEIGFFFSLDGHFDPEEDVLLHIEKVLFQEDKIEFFAHVPLNPVELEEGYLMAFIDPYDFHPEYTRSNNLAAFPISVKQTPEPEDEPESQLFLVYPNPFQNELHLRDSTEHFQLYNLFGQLVAKGENTNYINTERLQSGVYLLQLSQGELVKVLKAE